MPPATPPRSPAPTPWKTFEPPTVTCPRQPDGRGRAGRRRGRRGRSRRRLRGRRTFPGVVAACSPRPARHSPIGTTTVTCTATDAAGTRGYLRLRRRPVQAPPTPTPTGRRVATRGATSPRRRPRRAATAASTAGPTATATAPPPPVAAPAAAGAARAATRSARRGRRGGGADLGRLGAAGAARRAGRPRPGPPATASRADPGVSRAPGPRDPGAVRRAARALPAPGARGDTPTTDATTARRTPSPGRRRAVAAALEATEAAEGGPGERRGGGGAGRLAPRTAAAAGAEPAIVGPTGRGHHRPLHPAALCLARTRPRARWLRPPARPVRAASWTVAPLARGPSSAGRPRFPLRTTGFVPSDSPPATGPGRTRYRDATSGRAPPRPPPPRLRGAPRTARPACSAASHRRSTRRERDPADSSPVGAAGRPAPAADPAVVLPEHGDPPPVGVARGAGDAAAAAPGWAAVADGRPGAHADARPLPA